MNRKLPPFFLPEAAPDPAAAPPAFPPAAAAAPGTAPGRGPAAVGAPEGAWPAPGSVPPDPAAPGPTAPGVPKPPFLHAGATRGQRLGLVLGLLAATLLGLWLFANILTPFVLAACIAYFLDPVATRLTRLGMPRSFASGLLILALAAGALLVVLLLYPLLVQQVGVLIQQLPRYITGIGQAIRDAVAALEARFGPDVATARLRDLAVNQAGSIISFLANTASRLIGGSFALFNVFTFVVVTPVVAFYLLRDWPRIIARVEGWLPRRSADTLRQLARDTDRVLSAWLRGQLICCALLAVFYAVALSLAGLELGLTVGLMSGFLTFIPYVGSTAGLLTSLLLALAQFATWSEVAVVLAIFVAGQVVEGYVIYPRLLGDRVELHAVWVIFALFAGGVAFGFLGVLLAVPMAAAIGVLARYWLRRYLESPLYLDPPRLDPPRPEA